MTVAVAAPTRRLGPRFLSLRWKLLVGFTLLFSAVFAAAFYWFYAYTSDRILAGITADLRSTLVGAAERVEVGSLRGLYDEGVPNAAGFSDDLRYAAQMRWLDAVHRLEPRAWPYLYVPGTKPGEVVFVVDLYSKYDPTKAAKFRESYEPITPFPVRGLSETVVNASPYTDKWGYWISGYTPIKDAAGKDIAALGVDFSASYLREVQRGIQNQMIFAFALTYLALFVMVLLLANVFTGPLKRLAVVAARIGEGRYEQNWAALHQNRLRDEIGTLTSVIEQMAAKVYQRERNLQQAVKELRIEIDEVKKAKQVTEIVDTDFFRDLKSRARSMRNRAERNQDGSEGQAEEQEPWPPET